MVGATVFSTVGQTRHAADQDRRRLTKFWLVRPKRPLWSVECRYRRLLCVRRKERSEDSDHRHTFPRLRSTLLGRALALATFLQFLTTLSHMHRPFSQPPNSGSERSVGVIRDCAIPSKFLHVRLADGKSRV